MVVQGAEVRGLAGVDLCMLAGHPWEAPVVLVFRAAVASHPVVLHAFVEEAVD